MANALVSIQVIPRTPNGESTIPYVDHAISLIQKSGVKYRVSPLETTMEGELSQLLSIIEEIHQLLASKGCSNVLSQIKVYYCPEGASMGELTKKYD